MRLIRRLLDWLQPERDMNACWKCGRYVRNPEFANDDGGEPVHAHCVGAQP